MRRYVWSDGHHDDDDDGAASVVQEHESIYRRFMYVEHIAGGRGCHVRFVFLLRYTFVMFWLVNLWY